MTAPVLTRMAHAVAWKARNVTNLVSPKGVYASEPFGWKSHWEQQAARLLDALRRAGLVVTVRKARKRARKA